MIKTIKLLGLLLTLSIAFSSCSSQMKRPEVTHIPVRIKDDGNWSLLEVKTGKILFEGEFKNRPSAVIEGIFITEDDKNRFSYQKLEDEKKYKQIAGPFKSAQSFTEGIAIVCKEDEHISAIDTKGEEVFKLTPDGSVEFKNVGQCYDGMIVFQDQNGFYGYLDNKGKIAIKPTYDMASDFNGGFARVVKRTKDKDKDKVQIIDKEGKVNDVDYAYVGPVDNNRVAYSNSKNEYGIVDISKSKEKVLNASSKFERIILEQNDIYYSADNLWGVINEEGEILIRAKYTRITRLNSDRYLAIKAEGDDSKFEILDAKGEIIKSDDADNAFVIGDGVFIAKDGKDWEVKNHEGEALGNSSFKNLDGSFLNEKFCSSNYTQSLYFNWSLIDNSIKKISASSFLDVPTTLNCIDADPKIKAISLGQKESANKEISQGVANYPINVSMVGWMDYSYFGNGYSDDSESSDNKDAKSAETKAPSTENTSGVDDQAPDWNSYQRNLTRDFDLGNSNNLTVTYYFDDFIKKSITQTTYEEFYGYSYPVDKVVGYEKNKNAFINYCSISYKVYDEAKKEKIQKKLKEFITKNGFQLSYDGGSYKEYTDNASNTWKLSDNNTLELYLAVSVPEYPAASVTEYPENY